jgi:ferredoxin
MSKKKRFVVDYIACRGYGMCAYLFPENFRLDEWGYPIVTDDEVPAHGLKDARRLARMCPELALRLEEKQKKAAPKPDRQPAASSAR